ncbi:hypothetical protein A4R44_00032 [Amycolatopsis sp. M39]|nr:hypothetical protein A4R44_00032 [Amycolatopsis sp. M39]
MIIANQYSNSPKMCTAAPLTTITSSENTATGTHSGIRGHQNWTYTPAAIVSPPIAITCMAQYAQRTTNPLPAPRYLCAMLPNAPAAGCTTTISASAQEIARATSPQRT